MSGLKVLMADDELPIRKWFEKTFQEITPVQAELVGIASNGGEALALFREAQPDVIFADIKMPVMDGLTLLRLVKQERPSTQVVIVTSYDEFAYAKESIAQGAFDYVLKTEVTPKKLGDILLRIQAASRNASAEKAAISLRFSQEVFLNRLLAGETAACTQEELNRHGIMLHEHAMFAVAFQTNQFDPDGLVKASLNASVEHICYYPYQKNLVVALANTACIDQLAFQNQVIFQFANKISQCFGSPTGVSGLYYKYERLPAMIGDSVAALSRSFYDASPQRVYYAQDASSFRQVEPVLRQWEEQLSAALRDGELKAMPGRVEQILDYIARETPGDVDGVKQFFCRVMTNFYIMDSPNHPDLPERLNRLHSDISQSGSYAQLRGHISRMLSALVGERDLQPSRYSVSIAKAVAYINKNFARIQSVAEVASHVELNPDYFCHLFKRDTGVTFTQFLNQVRLNKAIWLLNNTTLKTYEVAERVGYANQGYFSKLFKQRFHMTPYEFRGLNGVPADKA